MSESSIGSSRARYGLGCYCARCTACLCGIRAVVRASKTPENYGKKFYGCINYNRGGCYSFIWFDEVENGCAFMALKQERDVLKIELEEWKCFSKDLREEAKALKSEISLLKGERDNLKTKNDKMWKNVILIPLLLGIVFVLSLQSSPLMFKMLN